MLNGKISILNNSKGEPAFPITSSRAVYMENGTTVEDSINLKSDKGHKHLKSDISDWPNDIATETFVTNAIADAQLTGEGNLSNYATKIELSTKVDKVVGKSLISDTEIERLLTLENYDDSSIRSSLNNITTNYATKDDLHYHDNKAVLDGITETKVTSWDNKSDFSGNYNNLTNKPNIPTKISELENDSNFTTNSYVNEMLGGKRLVYLTQAEYDILTEEEKNNENIVYSITDIDINYVTEEELNNKEYATKTYVANAIADAQLSGDGNSVDLSGYATKTELSTKVDKVNGKSLILDTEITRLSTLVNYDDSSIRSSLNNITTNYATKAELVSKVDKVNGQSLVPDSEIKRLLTLKNYDDTYIRSSLTEITINQGNLTNLLTTNKTDLVQAINELYRMIKGDSTEEVKTVTLDKTSAVISVNDTTTITATITPSSPADKDVTWSCDNSNVTLNDNGLTCTVTGAKVGTSIVTFRTADGYTVTCTITVVSSSSTETTSIFRDLYR